MVKSDAVLLHGKDSSQIAVVSEGKSAPRVEMRKKLPIPPPFVVSSNSYAPEYPWMGQPRPAPRAWSWRSTARIALCVLVVVAAFGLLIYCGQWLLRWKKPATHLPRADELKAPVPPTSQDGSTAQVISGMFLLPDQEDSVPSEQGDGVVAVPAPWEASPPVLPGEMSPTREQEAALPDQVFEISISISLDKNTKTNKMGQNSEEEASTAFNDAPVILREDDGGLLISSSLLGNGEVTEGELATNDVLGSSEQVNETGEKQDANIDNYLKSAGLISETSEAVRDQILPSANEDSRLVKSAGLTSEMAEAEITSIPDRESTGENSLLKSAGLISEVVEATKGDSFPRLRRHDSNLLRSAGLISEIAEARMVPHPRLEVNLDDKLVASSGMISEIAESMNPERYQESEQDQRLLRFAGMTGEMAEGESLRAQHRSDHDKSLLRAAGLTSEMIEAESMEPRWTARKNDERPTATFGPSQPISKLVDSAGVTVEDVKAIFPYPSTSTFKKEDESISDTAVVVNEPENLTPTSPTEDSSPDVTQEGHQNNNDSLSQTGENSEERPPIAVTRAVQEKQAKKLALLGQLRDLMERQRMLAERSKKLRLAQQEDSQRQHDPASAMERMREAARRQAELADIARTFREQIKELRTLQTEGKQLGIFGSASPASQSSDGGSSTEPEQIRLNAQSLSAEGHEAPLLENAENQSAEGHEAPLLNNTQSQEDHQKEKDSPLQTEENTGERPPVAVTRADQEKQAKKLALLGQLRDLMERQRMLAERSKKLRLAQQEDSQRQQDPASAMERMREAARRQAELADIARTFREQIEELRTLQTEGKQLGIFGAESPALQPSEVGSHTEPEQIRLSTQPPSAEGHEAPLLENAENQSAEGHEAPLLHNTQSQDDHQNENDSPVQIEENTGERPPVAVTRADQEKQARTLDLLRQLRDLIQRQRMLAERLRKVHMDSQRQQDPAAAMERMREVVGIQQELADIARTYRKQIEELGALQAEGRELGIFGAASPVVRPSDGGSITEPEQIRLNAQPLSAEGHEAPLPVNAEPMPVVVYETYSPVEWHRTPQPQAPQVLPLMEHVLEQRQRQREAWRQEQRALAYLQLLDLYRQHHHQEAQVEQQERAHREALHRLRHLAAEPHADSIKLLSEVIGSPIALSHSCPHCDLHHARVGSRALA